MSAQYAELAAQLLAQAQAIAAARAEELALARTDPAARWRKASLLWPRFARGRFTEG